MFSLYLMTNQINGKIYVGFTSATIEERFKQHAKDAGAHKKNGMALHSAIRKYGIDNFTIKTLEIYESSTHALEREEPLIVLYDARNKNIGYNIATGGHAPMLGRTLSQESRTKMSISRSGEKNCNYGKPMSNETKKKLSDANKNKVLTLEHKEKLLTSHIGIARSEETKRKLSIAQSGERHSQFGTHRSSETKQKISSSSIGLQANEKHPQSKLTWDIVRNIRNDFTHLKLEQKFLAVKYNLSAATISRLLNDKSWIE